MHSTSGRVQCLPVSTVYTTLSQGRCALSNPMHLVVCHNGDNLSWPLLPILEDPVCECLPTLRQHGQMLPDPTHLASAYFPPHHTLSLHAVRSVNMPASMPIRCKVHMGQFCQPTASTATTASKSAACDSVASRKQLACRCCSWRLVRLLYCPDTRPAMSGIAPWSAPHRSLCRQPVGGDEERHAVPAEDQQPVETDLANLRYKANPHHECREADAHLASQRIF